MSLLSDVKCALEKNDEFLLMKIEKKIKNAVLLNTFLKENELFELIGKTLDRHISAKAFLLSELNRIPCKAIRLV